MLFLSLKVYVYDILLNVMSVLTMQLITWRSLVMVSVWFLAYQRSGSTSATGMHGLEMLLARLGVGFCFFNLFFPYTNPVSVTVSCAWCRGSLLASRKHTSQARLFESGAFRRLAWQIEALEYLGTHYPSVMQWILNSNIFTNIVFYIYIMYIFITVN